MDLKDISILIPARMESTRFPGKPLAPIQGIPMIVYCARNAMKTGLNTYVCTDSMEVKSVCDLYKVKSILTPKCNTGTDRIAKAIENIDCEYVINLQGDEPLIDSNALQKFIENMYLLENDIDLIISGVIPVKSEQAFDPNNVKCAILQHKNLIQYFSRKPLLNNEECKDVNQYFKQLGLYGMSRNNLAKFTTYQQGALELAEKVELLRWLENGKRISACTLNCDSISVDTPQDLVAVLEKVNKETTNKK